MNSKLIVALTLSVALAAPLTLASNALAQSPTPDLGVALMGAFVSRDGGISPRHSSGALSARRIDVGRYEVKFNRSIDGCTAAVTAASGAPRFAQFGGPLDDSTEILVRTYDAAGECADSYFTVFYFCPR